MKIISASLLCIALTAANAAAADMSPMERQLKEQIAKQRLKQERAKQAPKKITKKKPAAPKAIARPRYRVVMIAGHGRALWAHVVLPDKADDLIRVQKGDRLGNRFRVAAISEKGVIVSHRKQRWRLSFVKPR